MLQKACFSLSCLPNDIAIVVSSILCYKQQTRSELILYHLAVILRDAEEYVYVELHGQLKDSEQRIYNQLMFTLCACKLLLCFNELLFSFFSPNPQRSLLLQLLILFILNALT